MRIAGWADHAPTICCIRLKPHANEASVSCSGVVLVPVRLHQGSAYPCGHLHRHSISQQGPSVSLRSQDVHAKLWHCWISTALQRIL